MWKLWAIVTMLGLTLSGTAMADEPEFIPGVRKLCKQPPEYYIQPGPRTCVYKKGGAAVCVYKAPGRLQDTAGTIWGCAISIGQKTCKEEWMVVEMRCVPLKQPNGFGEKVQL
jgi:hypothetical protein